LLIGHGNTEDEARRLRDDLGAAIANVESSHVTPLGTALGVHGGPGMLVVGIERRP
jgi:fatty acid-binding protein DegV